VLLLCLAQQPKSRTPVTSGIFSRHSWCHKTNYWQVLCADGDTSDENNTKPKTEEMGDKPINEIIVLNMCGLFKLLFLCLACQQSHLKALQET